MDSRRINQIDRWCESIQDTAEPYGRFRYAINAVHPHCLAASCMTASILSKLNTLAKRNEEQKRQWTDYILSLQDSQTGLFIDPQLTQKDLKPSQVHTWEHIRTHTTNSAVSVLRLFGKEPLYPIEQIRWFSNPDKVKAFLESLPWGAEPWGGSASKVGMAASLHRVNKKIFGTVPEMELDDSLTTMFDWLENHQDPRTGLWGTDSGADILRAMCGAFCMAVGTYFRYNQPYPRPQKMVDTVLTLVQTNPIFQKGNQDDGVCKEFDALYLLWHSYKNIGYRQQDIRNYAQSRLEAVEEFAKPDGGFSTHRGGSIVYHNSVHVTDGQPQSDVLGTMMFVKCLIMAQEILEKAGN